MSSLSGKVAIITGSSSGIGEGIALEMAEKGACLTLCGRNQDSLNAVFQKCSTLNGNHPERLHVFAGDVTSSDCRKQMIEQTIQHFGQLDILILNAGNAFPNSSIELATEEMYDNLLDVHLKANFFLVQEAVSHLEKSKGAIVGISSTHATIPNANQIIYGFAKAAMDHMVRCLALALGPKGIRVNSVKPSYIETTRILRNFEPNNEEVSRVVIDHEQPLHPLEGRLCTMEEVVKVVTFLASSDSSFVTGESLHVDGGRRFNAE